jgi:hypothetical protein
VPCLLALGDKEKNAPEDTTIVVAGGDINPDDVVFSEEFEYKMASFSLMYWLR